MIRVIKSRRVKWAGYAARMEESMSSKKQAYPYRKDPLGSPWRRWEEYIRMNLEEIGINTKNWVDSAQDKDYWKALVNAGLNLRVP